MPQSLSAVYLHAVFSTKNREAFLDDPGIRAELHAHLAEISKRLDCPAIQVGGHVDHVHVLARFSRIVSVADWIKEMKRVSSLSFGGRKPDFAWQSGYGVFSVDSSTLLSVAAYVQNQEQHHRKFSFQDEFRKLLVEHDVQWDERYVWD